MSHAIVSLVAARCMASPTIVTLDAVAFEPVNVVLHPSPRTGAGSWLVA